MATTTTKNSGDDGRCKMLRHRHSHNLQEAINVFYSGNDIVTPILVQGSVTWWFQVHLGDLGGSVLNKIKSNKN